MGGEKPTLQYQCPEPPPDPDDIDEAGSYGMLYAACGISGAMLVLALIAICIMSFQSHG